MLKILLRIRRLIKSALLVLLVGYEVSAIEETYAIESLLVGKKRGLRQFVSVISMES